MTFKGRVIKSSLWSLAGGSSQQIISLIIFLYLAKVLDARAVGIIASAAIIADIMIVASRIGIMEAVQRLESNPRIESAAFWFTTLTGISASAVVVISSFIVRSWSHSPEVANVLLILAPLPALAAMTAVPEGLIRRNLDFRALTVRAWFATLAGGAVSIFLVNHDFGLYALAGQRVTSAVCSLVLIWTQARWHPQFRPAIAPAKETIRTGAMILVGNFSTIINQRVTDSVTAIFLGPLMLGYLRLSTRLSDVMTQMTIWPISNVALPTFSSMKHDIPAVRRMFLRLTQFMAAGSIPVFFGMGAVAGPLIEIVLGPKWLGSVVAFELLGFLVTAGAVGNFFSPLVVALGRADIVMKQSVAQILFGIPIIWIGSYYGLVGVLIAGIVRAALVSLMNMVVIVRVIEAGWWRIVGRIVPAFVSSLVMFACVRLAMDALPTDNLYLKTGLGIAVGAFTYGAAMLAGDFIGIWRHYVRGAVRTLHDGLRPRADAS